MRPSNKVTTSTNFDRILSPSDQLAIATHLQALRRYEDNLRACAAAWPTSQRRQLLRFVNQNRSARFSIWAALDIPAEVLP